ncbi:MAG: peptidoglycan domain protein [Paludibacteraceae bacterium]|nr:peptidoglycan domain protein [Paludibacteraceae bacterium]
MADYRDLLPIIKKWEGGYVNDPDDSGGATNKGVTLATFRQFYGKDKTAEDLKKLTDAQWLYIFLNGYWDKMKASQINNQAIANIIVDWAWASGPGTAAKYVQNILGINADGIVGPQTLQAINTAPQNSLFDKIKSARIKFVEQLAELRQKDKKFLNGWKNRINSFFFSSSAASEALQNYGILAGLAVLCIILISRKKWKRL